MSIATLGDQLPELPSRGPGRRLGAGAQPTLVLSIGAVVEGRRQDGSTYTTPTKIDHFRAKAGANGEYANAARKFHDPDKGYGPEPKAIDIILPAEFTTALDVRHFAWASAGGGDGGMLRARGRTNFATVGTLGGPDVLEVYNPDGTIDELEITGVDDPRARQLGVDLYTTFKFHVPKVLGLAAYASITSKGKKTTDNLYSRLIELYGMLGSRVTLAVRPKLVVRTASSQPVVVDKRTGERKRIKSTYYTLDLYVPEDLDAMVARLSEVGALLAAPARALYGPPALAAAPDPAPSVGEVEASIGGARHETPTDDVDYDHDDGYDPGDDEYVGDGEVVDHQPEPDPAPPAPPRSRTGSKFTPPASAGVDPAIAEAADTAAEQPYPAGRSKGKTLRDVLDQDPNSIQWALANWKTEPMRSHLFAFARVYAPDLYMAAKAEEELA